MEYFSASESEQDSGCTSIETEDRETSSDISIMSSMSSESESSMSSDTSDETIDIITINDETIDIITISDDEVEEPSEQQVCYMDHGEER